MPFPRNHGGLIGGRKRKAWPCVGLISDFMLITQCINHLVVTVSISAGVYVYIIYIILYIVIQVKAGLLKFVGCLDHLTCPWNTDIHVFSLLQTCKRLNPSIIIGTRWVNVNICIYIYIHVCTCIYMITCMHCMHACIYASSYKHIIGLSIWL